MKKYFLLIAHHISLIAVPGFIFFSPLFWGGAGGEVSAQNPLVKQWDKRFGGRKSDHVTCIRQTQDKDFILGGWTISSNTGNITEPRIGDFDYWVIKVSKVGNKKWDKRFGGTGDDRLFTMCEASDKGFLFGGYSYSDSSGNKSQDTWANSADYWVIKTDSLGNKQWDKDFGGLDYEVLSSVLQTNDGGYILGGFSRSGISGNITEPNRDSTNATGDFWIIKIDSFGNKQLDKRFGGTKNEGAFSICQTNNEGFIIAGSSNSNNSGDKTQPNWDTTLSTNDYWVVKIDSAGNKLLDKRFGGINDDGLSGLIKTTDGGYLMAGSSNSDISGDKTQPNWDITLSTRDYWIVKTDSLFNKLWDKRYGGLNDDVLKTIQQTSDGGFLLGGSSGSPISGDKSENNLGGSQTWIFKTDSLGNKLWDKTIFTTGNDYYYNNAIQNSDGCYMTATSTMAGIGGYKTQPNWDTIPPINQWDYWLIKFCDSTATTSITQLPNTQLPFSIYPNPANESLVVSDKRPGKKEIEIYDLFGRIIFQSTIASQQSTINIDVSRFSSGIYFI